MATTIRPLRVNHMNAVVEDFDASVAHYRDAFGAELMADMPQKEFHACLVEMGQVIIELFVPWDFLVSVRYGPHYLGLEWQADLDAVRAAVAERGMRIVRDIGVALHTHPADGFGLSHEFYAGSFHGREWPLLGGKPIRPASFWRDEHPLGLTGLRGYVHAVEDLDAACAFYQGFLAAEPLFEERRADRGGRAVGLRVADAVVELIAPDGAGWTSEQLRRSGQGIVSTVFGVRDVAQARSFCIARGLPLETGTAQGRIAVPAAANRGLSFEFDAS